MVFLLIPNHILLFIFKFEGWGVRKSKECTSKKEEGECGRRPRRDWHVIDVRIQLFTLICGQRLKMVNLIRQFASFKGALYRGRRTR